MLEINKTPFYHQFPAALPQPHLDPILSELTLEAEMFSFCLAVAEPHPACQNRKKGNITLGGPKDG